MPFIRHSLSLVLICTQLFAVHVFANDDPTPFALDAGRAPTSGIDKTLEWDNKSDFKAVKRVVLPEYSIEFLMDNSAASSAGTTSVAMRWQLQGVGSAEFQAITDAAYADLRQSLEAAGFEVVTADAMQAQPAYAKMQAQGKPSGTATDSGLVMAPAGMVVMPLGTLSERDQGSSGMLGGLSALKQMGAVASAISGGFDTQEMVLALDATVLQLHIAVDFSRLEAKRGLAQRMSGKVAVEGTTQPAIAAESTALRIFTNEQKGARIALAQPLLLPPDTFAGSEEATSTRTKLGDAAGTLLRIGAGISGSSETKEYVVTAEPEQYKLRMIEGLAQLNAALVASLAAAR